MSRTFPTGTALKNSTSRSMIMQSTGSSVPYPARLLVVLKSQADHQETGLGSSWTTQSTDRIMQLAAKVLRSTLYPSMPRVHQHISMGQVLFLATCK